MTRKLKELRGRDRRHLVLLVVLASVAAFGIAFTASSRANLAGSTFEGNDGNLVVGTAGNTDWANQPGVKQGIDEPSGNADNAFGIGTKEDDPAVSIVDGSIPPAKNDLTRFYAASDFTQTDDFLYLSWQRTNTNGDANLDFELNQNPTASFDGSTTGALTLNRTAGDVLITYDFGGSGTPTIGVLHWLTTGSKSDCYSANALPCWGNHSDATPPITEAKVNDVTVTDPLHGGASLVAGQFGEASIDLNAAGVFPTDTCESFGGVWVKSRSSSSFSAEVKDFIAPTPIHVANCGTIQLKKHWVGTPGTTTINVGKTAGAHDVATQAANGADAATSAVAVKDGTYFISESAVPNYSTTQSCFNDANGNGSKDAGEPDVAINGTNGVAVVSGDTVVCTITNTRNQGTIELKKVWIGAAGTTVLNIGSTAGASDVAQKTATADDTTGTKTVDTATYFVSENLTSAGDYDSSLTCTDNGTAVSPGANNSLAVATGHAVICTFTNSHKPTIELKKHWIGTAGTALLKIGSTAGGTEVTSKSVTTDDTTGAQTVAAGTYFVAETVTNPSTYTSALACTDNGQPATTGANSSLALADGHVYVCTYTNTRNQGMIELKKVWVGTPGTAVLDIGSTAGASDVAQKTVTTNDTTGAANVDTGTYFVSENVTSPASYDSSLACTDNGASVNPGANSSLAVATGHAVVCTYTNVAKPSIELKKVWVGTAGTALLKIGSTAGASNVASKSVTADDTTGAQLVSVGTYFLSETVTNASSFTSALACTDNGQAVAPGASNSLALAAGHVVVCTFTNTRNQGSIELKKHWVGTAGSAVLNIGSTAGTSDVAQKTATTDDTTGAKTVDTGTYFVSEDVTTASDYTSSLACTDNGTPVTPGANSSLAVANGHAVVCTFTNTRKQGTIELKKHWVGTPGSAVLNIGSTAGTHDVAQTTVTADGTTGSHSVDTGTYFVSEDVTPAGDYARVLACTDNGTAVTPGANSSLAVGTGHTVICTYTNSRNQGTIELKKHWVGTPDSADLGIGSTAGAHDVALKTATFDDTTGAKAVNTGTYFVSEAVAAAGHYDSSLACTDNGATVSPGEDGGLSVATGHAVVCTFTNARKPTITIVKNTIGGNDTFGFSGPDSEGSFTITTAGLTGSKSFEVEPGAYHVSENLSNLLPWSLTGLSCSTGGTRNEANPSQADITVAAGDNVTCTFTNTKNATLIVKKVVDNSNGGGSLTPADFTLHVTQGGLDVTGSPQAGTSTGTTYSLFPGTYKVAENGVSGYNLTSITGCLADGSVVLDAGSTVTCTLTNTSKAPPPPPPPPPPAPRIDLSITKAGAPSPLTVGGNITWTLVVTNNGPNNATGVTVADPIPAGTTYVSSATSQGTCTGGAILSCQIGNLPVGASVTITLLTTAHATGTVPNTATTVGNEVETNTANNSASASVKVIGVFTPPPTYCTALAVSPKQLLVGHKNTLTIRVSQHGKAMRGVKIRIKGSTISLVTAASNGKGLVKRTVKPTKAGIITFVPVAQKGCKSPRIGVIGVFTPPVTG